MREIFVYRERLKFCEHILFVFEDDPTTYECYRRTTLKQGTANENAANVGSSKGSDQRENDK